MSEEQKLNDVNKLPLTKDQYDPGKKNDLNFEDEIKCWYNYVYKGNEQKEWTVKVFVIGVSLACLMVLINIYMGLNTGWGEGGSIIAVLLTFLILSVFIKSGIIKSYGELETNMIQTVASAGGSLGNMVNVVPALLLMGYALTWYDMFLLVCITSFMGVFFAIPLRRQNVIVEKLRFPTGSACYQTIKAIHEKSPDATAKARALAISGAITSIFAFSQNFLPLIKKWIGAASTSIRGTFLDSLTLPGHTFLSAKASLQQVYYGIQWSPVLFGIGFMTGPRVGVGMLVGGMIGFIALPEILLRLGYIESLHFHHIRDWVMWPSTSLLVFASFVTLAFKLPVMIRAFKGLQGKASTTLSQLDVPKHIFWIGLISCIVAGLIFMNYCFEINIVMAMFAIILSFILAMIAVRSAGETDINPVGSMGHVTQIAYGKIFPCSPQSNLGASGVTAAGASEAGDMMQDLKTGYLIGATPKRQVYIQMLGIFVGSIVSVILLFALLYDKDGSLTIKEKAIITGPKSKDKSEDHMIMKYRFTAKDFRSMEVLLTKLQDKKTPFTQYIYSKMSKTAQDFIKKYNSAYKPDKEIQLQIIKEFNSILNRKDIYSKKRFANIALPKNIEEEIKAVPKGNKRIKLNRLLLEIGFPLSINRVYTISMRELRYPAPAAQVWRALAIAMSGGDALLKKDDFKQPLKLIDELKNSKDPLMKHFRKRFAKHTITLLQFYDGYSKPPKPLLDTLVYEINKVMRKENIYKEEFFKNVKLREKTKELVKLNPRNQDMVLLNRLLLEDKFPELIVNKISLTVKDIKDATKLMIELKKPSRKLTKQLKKNFSKGTLVLLDKYTHGFEPSQELVTLVLRDLNREIFNSTTIYDKDLFKDVNISTLLRAKAEKQNKGNELFLIDKTLLQQVYHDLIREPYQGLPRGAEWGIIIGAILGIILGLLEQTKFGRFMPSNIGIGIALILPLSYDISIFLGSMAHVIFVKSRKKNIELVGPVAAGMIAFEPIIAVPAQLLN